MGSYSAAAPQARNAGLGRPLRLAFFVHYFPMVSEAFIVNQAAALRACGHEVDVFALWGLHPAPAERFPVVARANLMARARTPECPERWGARLRSGWQLLRRGFAHDPGLRLRALDLRRHGRWALNLRLLHEAAMLDGRGPYDVVHCQFADLAPIVLRLRRIGAFDAPVAVHLRGIDITRRVRELGTAAYARIFEEADAFLPNCDHFRRRAIALGCPPEKLTVFRSAIDLDAFAWRGARGGNDPTVRLALVGRLVEKKGVADAIDAVGELAIGGLDLTLDILGDGPLRAPLEARARALGVADRVRFRGAGGHADVIALLRASDLLLAPSVKARDGDEDAPVNTLKEAMAIGLPVVATRHGGIPELVRDGISGRLVPERDPAALAAAIHALVRRRAQWPDMGQAGREAVAREYEVGRQTQRLVALDQALAERWRTRRLARTRHGAGAPAAPVITTTQHPTGVRT